MNYFTDIIQFAIDREIEAETFYLEIAAKTTKEAMRGMFVGFAAEEKRHQEMLKGVRTVKRQYSNSNQSLIIKFLKPWMRPG